jgi:hypothetical protein
LSITVRRKERKDGATKPANWALVTYSQPEGAAAALEAQMVVMGDIMMMGEIRKQEVVLEVKKGAIERNLENGKAGTLSIVQQQHKDIELDSETYTKLKAEAIRKATDEEEGSKDTRNLLLGCVCFLEMMANFDAGVLPATVGHVMSEFELDYADGGVLGALVYLGLVIGAPVAGYTLTNFNSQRQILMVAAIANCLGVLCFALAPSVPLLYVGRLLIGLTQAPLIVYMPVCRHIDSE